MIFANYHTHTTFCDGRDPPEQLVQEAIRLGVCRYLLKPSKMDELHEALAREHPKRLPLKGEPWGGGDWRNSTIPQIWCGFSFCTITSLH